MEVLHEETGQSPSSGSRAKTRCLTIICGLFSYPPTNAGKSNVTQASTCSPTLFFISSYCSPFRRHNKKRILHRLGALARPNSSNDFAGTLFPGLTCQTHGMLPTKWHEANAFKLCDDCLVASVNLIEWPSPNLINRAIYQQHTERLIPSLRRLWCQYRAGMSSRKEN